jgi:hypothetical protein
LKYLQLCGRRSSGFNDESLELVSEGFFFVEERPLAMAAWNVDKCISPLAAGAGPLNVSTSFMREVKREYIMKKKILYEMQGILLE